MYNHLLDTFKAVAEEGSFTKAAESLFLTHTAVRKQVGQLESYLGVKLFTRSQSGVRLNAAGQVLYAETLKLMKESADIIGKVQDAYFASPHTLRVGSSNLYPCYIFMDLWDRISSRMPGWQLKVVSFSDDRNRLALLGQVYDFVVGPYDSFPAGSLYDFHSIGTYRFTISVPRSHSLASRKQLRFSDLAGEPLMVMKPGTSPVNDAIRETLTTRYPAVNIVDIDAHYDMQTFNRAVETGSLLLSLECWDRVHPDIRTVPLLENYELPYGIVCRKDAEAVGTYVEQIDRIIGGKNV